MATILTAQLIAVTSTTTAGTAKTVRPNAWAIAGEILLLAAGFGIAYWRRRKKGNSPWRLPPILWGVFAAITVGFTIILEAIAWFTTNDLAPPRTSRYMSYRTPIASAPPRDPSIPPPMVPGTYGTSLPPHIEPDADGSAGPGKPGDPDWVSPAAVTAANQPAGWRADPTGRHEYRYWSGSAWTTHVSDEGRRSVDPL